MVFRKPSRLIAAMGALAMFMFVSGPAAGVGEKSDPKETKSEQVQTSEKATVGDAPEPGSKKQAPAPELPKVRDTKRARQKPTPPPQKADPKRKVEPPRSGAGAERIRPPTPSGPGTRGDTKAPGSFGRPGTKGTSVQASPEIGRFLDRLSSAGSLEEVRATFEEKQLSQAELQELRRGLKGSPAEARLRTLLANDQGKKTKGASRSLAALEARKKELDTQRVKLRSQKRNQAETMLVRAKARLPSAGRTIRDRTSSALAPPRPPAEGAPGRITSVSPSPVRIGTSLVISGSEFGAAQGRVGVYVGRDLEYCDIASWSDGRITATLTESIAARVGESEASGFVWVKPNGYDTGPSEEIRIQPDPDSLIPRIDRLSDDTVEPGLLLVIEGSHFLSERNGTVQMRLESGESFDLSITEWTDGYVAGTFEDISGVVGGTALLTLRNHAGQEATRSVTFQPHLVLRTFRFPPNTVHCEAWMSGTDRGGPLCFVGQKETSSSHSLFLDDGWEIIDFYVEEIDSLGWTGWEITRAPLLNRTGVHFDFDVEIWAEMYSTIQVRPVAVGQGPSGVDLWPMYR